MWFWYKHEWEKFTSQRRFTMSITSICSKGPLSSFVSFISLYFCVIIMCTGTPVPTMGRQSRVMISAREFCAVLVVLLSLPRSFIVEWVHSNSRRRRCYKREKWREYNMGNGNYCCCDGPYWTLDSDLIYCCCGGLFNKFTNIFSIMFVLWCLSYNIWNKKCRNATT